MIGNFSLCGRIHRGERGYTACSSGYSRRQTSIRYSDIQSNLSWPKQPSMWVLKNDWNRFRNPMKTHDSDSKFHR